MMKRKSSAVWTGSGLEGAGSLTTQSGVFSDQPYSFNSRFVSEDGKAGTNPEELIAAAHAGCFTMAMAFGLGRAGHEPTRLSTEATVKMEKGEAGWSIASIHLDHTAEVPGIENDAFQEVAEGAKKGCPISQALAAVEITLDAKLS